MREGEDLTGLGVGTVDEDERSEIIAEREAAELAGVERAVGVVAHDAAHHDEYAELVQPGHQQPDGFVRVACLGERAGVEIERSTDLRGGAKNVRVRAHRADEAERLVAHQPGMLSEPILALLAEVDGVQEIRRGA